MTILFGATVAKRRLSRRLTELRIASGYTANQVCDKLNWGRGKVGRFEANTWRRPEMSDIRDLLRIYGVDEPEAAELEALAVRARERGWWREYGDVFGDSEHTGYEADAERISVYMPLILPGLLQTPAYIDAHMRVGTKSDAWRRRALEARLRRQQILDRDDGAPSLVALITEASLMYRWGSQADRRAQVAHLAEVGSHSNIEVRLLRFADGPHPGMSSLISIFDFPADEPSLVYLQNDVSVEAVTQPHEIDDYVATFAQIRAAALDTTATMTQLKHLAQSLE